MTVGRTGGTDKRSGDGKGEGSSDGCAPIGDSAGKPVRTRPNLTKARRMALLEQIAATCNVSAAARAVGTTQAAIYKLKGRDAAFCEQFAEAVQAGYERIEAELLAHTLAGGGGRAGTAENRAAGIPGFDAELALRVLQSRSAAQRERPRRGGAPVKRASEREIEDALVAKLKGLARRLALIA